MAQDRHAQKFLLAVIGASLCLLFAEVWFEIHFPGTDVFLFKEAGINLAQKGRFVASNLPHMPFGVEKTFAYYPPLYPLFFGAWSWLFGVGLPQSLAFNSFLTFIRTLLMLFLLIPNLPQGFFGKEKKGTQWAVGTLFVCLSLVTTDRDRPDELAIIFGLIFLFILKSSQKRAIKLIGASVSLALVGATSPACGVLFGLIALIGFPLSTALWIGVGSGVAWILIILPVVLKDWASGTRFSKQVGLSSFPYLKNIHDWGQWKVMLDQFLWNLNSFYRTGTEYVHLALIILILGGWCFRKNRNKKLFLVAPFIYAFLVPFIWTLQPYYLWFPVVPMLVGILAHLSRVSENQLRVGLAFVYLGIIPLLFWEAKCVYNTLWIPESEKRPFIARSVLEEIEPQARLGVTHDQYFTFRNNREVINVEYWAHELSQLDYLYLTDLSDSRRQNRKHKQILSHDKGNCFQLVKDFSSYQKLPHPKSSDYYVRGNGGMLFKNSCTHYQVNLENPENPPVKKTNQEASG